MRFNDVSKQPTIGINVRSDGNIDYADLIVDGRKKYESRRTDSLRPYVGKTVAIVRTGRGQAVAIGQATVGEPIVVDAFKFDQMRKQHRVPAGSAFDIEVGAEKYLYPMIDPVRWDVPKPVKNKGIVARKIDESAGRVGNKLHDPKEYADALKGFRNYFGEREKAENELDGYSSGLDWLNKNGGKIYRVVFADSPQEVRIQDLNHHWTWDSSMLDYFIENLWSNYGEGKKNAYVIEATVPPMSLSNYGVDVQGNPEEQEVNIAANQGAITYKLFQKDGWKLVPVE